MKKNEFFSKLFYRSLKKTLKIMRNAIFLLILGVLQAHAIDTYSQKTKLSIDFSDTKLINVLDKIENESEFYFLYNEKLLDIDRKVSIVAKDQLLNQILDNLFAGTDVKYTIIDRKIILAPDYLTESSEQQQRSISGIVKDENGFPLPGVNIQIEGTIIGAISDAGGKYSIVIPNDNAVLIFSFIGYNTQKISVSGKTTINITLVPSVAGLEEVVVIGYGTQKKVDLTGSVTMISNKNIEKEPVVDALQALQGKAAGVEIISNSGQPGAGNSIRIRGIQSWSAGTEPVYVIDGVITESMGSIDPNDIESISVLKDASSTAIYGARGANGVVLITTKRGNLSTAPVISFHTYQGFQTESNLAKKFKMLNASEYLKLMKESWNGVAGDPFLTFDADAAYAGINTDWKKLIMRTGRQQYYDLSIKGGNERATYYSSVGYLTNKGVIKGQGQDRLTFRLNSDYKINKFIEFGSSLNLSHGTFYGWPDISGVGNEGINVGPNPYTRALEKTPVTRAYEADGSYGKTQNVNIEHKFMPPQAYINDCINDNTDFGIIGNVYVKLNILKGLSFTPRVSIDYNNFNSSQFIPKFVINDGITEYIDPNIVQKYNAYYLHWITDYMLRYENTFAGVHNVSALLMYSQEENSAESLRALRFNTLNSTLRYLDAASPDFMTNANSFSDWAFISYVGRLNYNYAERYLLEVSVRRDGSSKFGKNNRWGVFPSASVAWRVSGENFFQGFTNVVNNLKIRASVGTVGFSGGADYPSYSVLSSTLYTLNDAIASGYTSSVPSNADLKWEKRKNYDVGIDASFFKSKLDFTADYYIGRTSDMIIQTNIPPSAGKIVNAYINGGEIRNRGYEFELNYKENKGNFSYEINANFAASRNEVINTVGQNRRTDGIEIGLPVFSVFGMKTHGIIKTNDILNNYPQHEFAELGDIWKEDVNGDGKVDANDYTFIGKTYPDFTYGFGGTIVYKRLSIHCALLGVQGFDLYTQGLTLSYFESNPQNQDTRILDRWHPTENPNGNMPRITKVDPSNNIGDISDFWLSDASFLRINNVNIKYALPKSLCNKMQMRSLEVYGSIQNLYTFTKFPGPEVDVTPGDVFARIPQPRTWVIGVIATF
jgi:TonB-linked SusC/RagA family outer membrane protein